MDTSQTLVSRHSLVGQLSYYSERLAVFFTAIALLCLPFSHYLLHQSIFIAAVFAVLSGNNKRWLTNLMQLRAMPFILLLIALLAISLSYTTVSVNAGVTHLVKFTKLLFILILLKVFSREQDRKLAINTFIIGVLVATLFCYAVQWHWLTLDFAQHLGGIFSYASTPGAFSSINPLHLSVLQAFALFFLVRNVIDKQYYWPSLVGFLVMLFYLFYLNTERTGYLLSILLIGILLLQRLLYRPAAATQPNKSYRSISFKYFGVFAISLIIIISTMWLTSTHFRSRLHQAYYSFVHTGKQHQLTSIEYRKHFFQYSLKAIARHPILGTGIGSFAKSYHEVHGPTITGTTQLTDPHDDFLFIAVQNGLLGLVIFLGILYTLWLDFRKLPRLEYWFAQALGIGFIVNTLINATIASTVSGGFYVLMTAILLGARFAKR